MIVESSVVCEVRMSNAAARADEPLQPLLPVPTSSPSGRHDSLCGRGVESSAASAGSSTGGSGEGGRGSASRRELHAITVASFRTFAHNALLAYNVRAGISTIFRLLTLLRSKRPADALDIGKVFSESHLKFRVEAVRVAFAFGGSTGIFQLVVGLLRRLRPSAGEKGLNDFVAGTASGIAVLFMDEERQRTLALYIMARALQCLYNGAKARGWWHFWGSSWEHGDALLFGVSSAQIMYAYVMRPDTLPEAYWKFIVKTGPIDGTVLGAVRAHGYGLPLAAAELNAHCARRGFGGGDIVASALPRVLPVRALHPHTASSLRATAQSFVHAFQQGWPLYTALTFAPALVLRFGRFVAAPISSLLRCTLDTLRSTVFLSCFVSGYMGLATAGMRMSPGRAPSRALWWVAGLLTSVSVLIEQKSRRAELGLYVLPRAADSLFRILRDKRYVKSLAHGEAILFALSVGTITYFHQNERDAVSPMMRRLLDRILETDDVTGAVKGEEAMETPQEAVESRKLA